MRALFCIILVLIVAVFPFIALASSENVGAQTDGPPSDTVSLSSTTDSLTHQAVTQPAQPVPIRPGKVWLVEILMGGAFALCLFYYIIKNMRGNAEG